MTRADPFGLWTINVGFTISGTWVPGAFGGGPNAQGAVGIVFDGKGNVGGYWTVGGAGAVGTPGVVGGVQGGWSNGDTICDLRGSADILGLNAAFGRGGTVDTFGGSGTRGQPVGGVGVTIGGGAGVSGYVGKSYTGVQVFGGNDGCTCSIK